MDRSSGVTEQLCDFIAERGVARSTDIREAFPTVGTNLQVMLKHPLSSGYLVSCIVNAPDRRGVMRDIAEFRVSESAMGCSYKEWKAKFDPATRGDLKPAKLPPRAAAALAVAVPRETLASPRSTREKGRIERAEACSVAPTPAADALARSAAGGDEITATWCLHSDGSMQLAKGGVSLTLAPAEALRFAQLCGLVTPYLADIRPVSGTH